MQLQMQCDRLDEQAAPPTNKVIINYTRQNKMFQEKFTSKKNSQRKALYITLTTGKPRIYTSIVTHNG